MEMVKEIYNEEDAEIISSIHFSQKSKPDKLIWRDSNIGLLTVKSAYYMARRIPRKEVHVQNTRNFVWGAIWKARVTPKVKVFVWRMIQGILPTGSAL